MKVRIKNSQKLHFNNCQKNKFYCTSDQIRKSGYAGSYNQCLSSFGGFLFSKVLNHFDRKASQSHQCSSLSTF